MRKKQKEKAENVKIEHKGKTSNPKGTAAKTTPRPIAPSTPVAPVQPPSTKNQPQTSTQKITLPQGSGKNVKDVVNNRELTKRKAEEEAKRIEEEEAKRKAEEEKIKELEQAIEKEKY